MRDGDHNDVECGLEDICPGEDVWHASADGDSTHMGTREDCKEWRCWVGTTLQRPSHTLPAGEEAYPPELKRPRPVAAMPLREFERLKFEEESREFEKLKRRRLDREGTVPNDNWQHRSKMMLCKTCMFWVEKEIQPGMVCEQRLGRCREASPTMKGWPAVFESDWCGSHKLDRDKIS